MSTASPLWDLLGRTPADELVEVRLALHAVVQLLASFGQTLVEPRPDDSHRSMTWDEPGKGFVSGPAADGLRAAIGLAPLRVELRRGSEVLRSFALTSRTVREAQVWLGGAVGTARGTATVELEWPEYPLPDAVPRRDEPLALGGKGLTELARWYQDAFAVLSPLAAATAEASPVRCWPHHFDIATLMTFPGEGDARYVGVGMSPGDDGYGQPYFYVNGWPAPDPGRLPAFDEPGGWHTQGWTGAALVGTAVTTVGESTDQRALVEDFLRRAVSTMRRLVLESGAP